MLIFAHWSPVSPTSRSDTTSSNSSKYLPCDAGSGLLPQQGNNASWCQAAEHHRQPAQEDTEADWLGIGWVLPHGTGLQRASGFEVFQGAGVVGGLQLLRLLVGHLVHWCHVRLHGNCLLMQIFKKEPFFMGDSNRDQLVKIAQVLGTDNLYKYLKKYHLKLDEEFLKLLGK